MRIAALSRICWILFIALTIADFILSRSMRVSVMIKKNAMDRVRQRYQMEIHTKGNMILERGTARVHIGKYESRCTA